MATGQTGARPRRRWLRIWSGRGLARLALLFALAAVGVHCMIDMPGESYRGALPELEPAEIALEAELRRDVEALSAEIGVRTVLRYESLLRAEEHVRSELRRAGLEVRDQAFEVDGRLVRNLEVELTGGDLAREIIVVGAHYDSAELTPGANDNASGVAALLALARRFAGSRPRRSLRLVAFVNEEPPFFQTPAMGSLVYARRCKERDEVIAGMISLETMGYYSDAPGSQRYPFPFGLLYPSRGDFIGFVGNVGSRAWVREAIGSFRRHARFPSEGAAVPGFITGVGWSDHWAFWKQGYPALMVTDTAPFRYPHYHAPSDTADKLHYDRLARVVLGLHRAIAELAGVPLHAR